MKSKGWHDFYTTCGHALRLLFRSKETRIIFAVSLLLLFSLLYFVEDAKEEKSVIHIGIADEDQSRLSGALLQRVKENEVFLVSEGSLSELTDRLQRGKLAAVFLIKRGYEISIERGEEEKLITLYKTKESEIPLVNDILAGEMMLDICTAKGFIEYSKVMGETERTAITKEAYSEYVAQTMSEDIFDFSFQITYLSNEGRQDEEPKNTDIYRQLVLAVAALMMGIVSIYAASPYYNMCHGRASGRVRLLPANGVARLLGCTLAATVTVLFFGTVFLAVICWKDKGTPGEFLSMFLCTAGFCGGIVLIAIFAARVCKSFTSYQLTMLVLMVLFGIVGMISVFDGLLWQSEWLRLIPHDWYVRQMMNLT